MIFDDSTIHPTLPGKSILIICCDDACLDSVRKKIRSKSPSGVLHNATYYRFECKGDTFQLELAHDLEHRHRSERYDEIYTCGKVYLPERMIHILQARLLNPQKWSGYFSKFP